MRVAIDCSGSGLAGDLRTTLENLVPALISGDPALELVLQHRSPRTERPALPHQGMARRVYRRVPPSVLHPLEELVGWPTAEHWTGPVDVFHGTRFWLPATRRARRILSVHDVMFRRHPELFRGRLTPRLDYHTLLDAALRRADRILAASRSTRRDLIEFCGVPEQKVWVVPYALDPLFGVDAPTEKRHPDISREFVLYPLGALERRKNLGRTLIAFERAFPRRADRPLLVLAGETTEIPRDLALLIDELHLEADVQFRAIVHRDELRGLMNAASWGMYLSLYEGFGLGPLEALACGLPMLTSCVASIPEVVGDASLPVNPEAIDEIASGMRHLHSSPGLRRRLSARGLERAGSPLFSWERVARQILAAYRDDPAAFSAAVRRPTPAVVVA